jgi:hypothetical protein
MGRERSLATSGLLGIGVPTDSAVAPPEVGFCYHAATTLLPLWPEPGRTRRKCVQSGSSGFCGDSSSWCRGVSPRSEFVISRSVAGVAGPHWRLRSEGDGQRLAEPAWTYLAASSGAPHGHQVTSRRRRPSPRRRRRRHTWRWRLDDRLLYPPARACSTAGPPGAPRSVSRTPRIRRRTLSGRGQGAHRRAPQRASRGARPTSRCPQRPQEAVAAAGLARQTPGHAGPGCRLHVTGSRDSTVDETRRAMTDLTVTRQDLSVRLVLDNAGGTYDGFESARPSLTPVLHDGVSSAASASPRTTLERIEPDARHVPVARRRHVRRLRRVTVRDTSVSKGRFRLRFSGRDVPRTSTINATGARVTLLARRRLRHTCLASEQGLRLRRDAQDLARIDLVRILHRCFKKSKRTCVGELLISPTEVQTQQC